MNLTASIDIIRYRDGHFTEVSDLMVNEVCLQLQINSSIQKRLFCSPAELEELVIGHLYDNSYIASLADIASLELDEAAFRAVVQLPALTSAPESRERRPLPNVSFTVEMLLQNQERFYEDSTLQKATAGVHRCALCDKSGTLLACEDISRHNAFDKVIGQALRKGIELRDKYLITSGRIPLDMMQKATVCGIPMVVSRSTPTIAAVEEARRANLTLLGFSRENRFNVYSGVERLI